MIHGWHPESAASGSGAESFVWLAAAWFGMMSAMMAPAVWPWVLAFRRFGIHEEGRSGSGARTVAFGLGYLASWLVYSAAAAAVQFALQRSGRDYLDTRVWPLVATLVLIGAGLFQFTHLKRTCLRHCRHPLSFFLSRWRNGSPSPFRLGLEHGRFCVGCCWALMGTALVVGMTNLWWMAALALAAFAEQVLPRGDLVRSSIGVALVLAGVTATLI